MNDWHSRLNSIGFMPISRKWRAFFRHTTCLAILRPTSWLCSPECRTSGRLVPPRSTRCALSRSCCRSRRKSLPYRCHSIQSKCRWLRQKSLGRKTAWSVWISHSEEIYALAPQPKTCPDHSGNGPVSQRIWSPSPQMWSGGNECASGFWAMTARLHWETGAMTALFEVSRTECIRRARPQNKWVKLVNTPFPLSLDNLAPGTKSASVSVRGDHIR